MRFHTILLAAAALFLPCAVSLAPIYGQSNNSSSNRYIVKVRPGVNISSICEATNTDTLYKYKVIHGFAAFEATLDEHQLRALRSEPNVEYIEKDMFASASSIVSQHDASWGLARLSTRERLIDQNPNHINFTYTHDSSAGEGVDIYVLGILGLVLLSIGLYQILTLLQGVYVEHDEFENGRAILGPNFVDFTSDEDISGHGTHCAGIAAGRRFGVAKNAQIISVKVLNDFNWGSASDVIAGIDYVSTRATSGRPSIASMSFTFDEISPLLDEAIAALTSSGVHAVVASGDLARDAFRGSPSREQTAITVGAISITDTRPDISNFGCVVDIHAPGMAIISAGTGCPDAIESRSGTSMAAAHVSGLIATLISSDGNISPADMKAKLKELAVNGALYNIPSLEGTPNLLAQNGLAPR